MSQRVNAIYENGAFRPIDPLNIPEGERVSLNVESKSSLEELSDVEDLLDLEFIQSCRQSTHGTPSLEEVQKVLSVFNGSLADYISEEREER